MAQPQEELQKGKWKCRYHTWIDGPNYDAISCPVNIDAGIAAIQWVENRRKG